jgi:hypothetical protein
MLSTDSALDMTQLEIMDWISFLKMLSVERTESFISELALPFDPEQFPRVIHLARGCLEFYMFPAIRVPEGHVDSPGLIEAWSSYRAVEGVLSNETLNELAERYANQSEDIVQQDIYSQLQGYVGSETANALKSWFLKDFPSCPNFMGQWLWALRLLFTDPPEGVSPTSPPPITDEERQYIKDHSIHYRSEQLTLEKRFYSIIQDAKADGPTSWEKVLQTYPAGGIGNIYPWLNSVQQCLWLRLIRCEWGKLRNELGHSTMDLLISWIRQQEKVLPFNTTLYDEPEAV